MIVVDGLSPRGGLRRLRKSVFVRGSVVAIVVGAVVTVLTV